MHNVYIRYTQYITFKIKDDIQTTIATDVQMNVTGETFNRMKKAKDEIEKAVSENENSEALEDISITDGGDNLTLTSENEDMNFNFTETENSMCIAVTPTQKTFRSDNMTGMFLSVFLYLGALIAVFCMLQAVMKALKDCQTPFSENVIQKMERFGYSLIPLFAVSLINNAVWQGWQELFSFSIKMDGLLSLVFVFLLVMVFKYGAMLQKESDDTL